MRGIATLAAVSLLTFATSWGYDSASRLVSMSYPTGLTLNYAYDGYGRLSTVTSNLGGGLGDTGRLLPLPASHAAPLRMALGQRAATAGHLGP